MIRILLASLISVLAVSCSGPRYVDYFPYHDDGTPKPKVALMPIVVASSVEPTSIGEEISEGIYYQLMNSGEFYVPTLNEMGVTASSFEEVNILAADISSIKCFANTDFLVGMEVIEHSLNNVDPGSQANFQVCSGSAANRQLSMRVRIKIVDIRYSTPKIVLYEIFKTSYSLSQLKASLSQSKTTGDQNLIAWGEPGYENTPFALAHDRLIKSLTARLEEVIWSCK